MKKNLLKTALAAFAMALGITGAWGQTTSTIYSQNFDDLTEVPSDWTQSGGSLTLETEGSNKYLKETTAGTGSRSAWYKGSAFADAVKDRDNWTIEFDCLIAEGTNTGNYSQGVWLLGSDKTFDWGTCKNPIIGVRKASKQANYTVYVNAEITETTISLTSNTYYHYVISYDTNTKKLSLTIQNADKTTDILVKTEFDYDASTSTMGNLEGIVIQAGRGSKDNTNGFTCIDNIVITTVSSEEIVTAPQANITAINGTKRTVTITAQDATHKLYYYFGDDSTNPTEYTDPITVSETSTLHYYAQSTSGTKSEVQDLVVNCVAVTLSAPSIMRMGANSYKITATQTATDGITPVPTIHYTIDGGAEQTVANGTTINDVDKDIEAWAEADGFTTSSKTTATYVAAYTYREDWSYDMNTFPSTYSITAIADAIDGDTKATINGNENMYNLNSIEKKDLYVENSTGWLLRNQSTVAFKCQYAKASIAINNVTTDDIIYIKTNTDGSKYSISSVTNGNVAYNYDYTEYFIVPEANGAVTVTMNTGTAIYTVMVGKRDITKTIPSATKLASFSATSNTAVPEGVGVYKAKIDGNTVTLTKVETSVIPANTGVIVKCETDGEKTFKVTLDGSDGDFSDNGLIPTSVEANATVPSTGTYYALSASEQTFGVVTGGITLSGNKAYLAAPASDAKQTTLSILFADELTGISSATAKTAQTDGAYYTLQGVKTLKPAKGLYIRNGKKVIVK